MVLQRQLRVQALNLLVAHLVAVVDDRERVAVFALIADHRYLQDSSRVRVPVRVVQYVIKDALELHLICVNVVFPNLIRRFFYYVTSTQSSSLILI